MPNPTIDVKSMRRQFAEIKNNEYASTQMACAVLGVPYAQMGAWRKARMDSNVHGTKSTDYGPEFAKGPRNSYVYLKADLLDYTKRVRDEAKVEAAKQAPLQFSGAPSAAVNSEGHELFDKADPLAESAAPQAPQGTPEAKKPATAAVSPLIEAIADVLAGAIERIMVRTIEKAMSSDRLANTFRQALAPLTESRISASYLNSLSGAGLTRVFVPGDKTNDWSHTKVR